MKRWRNHYQTPYSAERALAQRMLDTADSLIRSKGQVRALAHADRELAAALEKQDAELARFWERVVQTIENQWR